MFSQIVVALSILSNIGVAVVYFNQKKSEKKNDKVCNGNDQEQSEMKPKTLPTECDDIKNEKRIIPVKSQKNIFVKKPAEETHVGKERTKETNGDIKNEKRIISFNGKEYIFVKKLGEGAFGEVSLGKDRSTGKEFAIKFINKRKFKKAAREFHNMKLLKHKNIIRLYDAIEMWGDEVGDSLYLFMEYASGGDLHDYISNRNITNIKAKELFRQIVTGVQYLHKNGIAHRDLKPANILLDSNGVIKIADFGLSKVVGNNDQMHTRVGTPKYFAPEILNISGYNGFKADMYSLGIILHDIVTCYGRKQMSPDCHMLFKKLTNKLPFSRPSTDNVLRDRWLA